MGVKSGPSGLKLSVPSTMAFLPQTPRALYDLFFPECEGLVSGNYSMPTTDNPFPKSNNDDVNWPGNSWRLIHTSGQTFVSSVAVRITANRAYCFWILYKKAILNWWQALINFLFVICTVELLTNDHPHQRPSLSYDHISCDGQGILCVYESLTSDHPSYTTTPM